METCLAVSINNSRSSKNYFCCIQIRHIKIFIKEITNYLGLFIFGFFITSIAAPIIVGIVVKLFDYWLDHRDND